MNIHIWNEYRHEKLDENVAKIYPEGIHKAIGASFAGAGDRNVTCGTLDDPDQGLPEAQFESGKQFLMISWMSRIMSSL